MRKTDASDIIAEKFEEIVSLLHSAPTYQAHGSQFVRGFLHLTLRAAHRVPVEIVTQWLSKMAKGVLVFCQVASARSQRYQRTGADSKKVRARPARDLSAVNTQRS